MVNKPFNQAAENNKRPIFSQLINYLREGDTVLEIGSGSGQHAIFIAEQLPGIVWQTSDLAHQHPGIKCWIEESGQDNILAPLDIDVGRKNSWPQQQYDVVYSANTTHIMSWKEVQSMIKLIATVLRPDGLLIIYGPFNVDGQYTSESNARFDAFLKAQQAHMGLRCLDELRAVAQLSQLSLMAMHDMPANNKLLVFRRE